MRVSLTSAVILVWIGVTSCAGGSGNQTATGSAYVGPATLNLRSDLGTRAATTATVEHGERLEVLATRRRFVKVRTKNQAVGWTDSGYLLTQAQMNDLTELSRRAAALPSQGQATVFDTLNVHTGASRNAPSFAQLDEGDVIEVIGHRITPRSAAVRRPVKLGTSGKDKDGDMGGMEPEDLPPLPEPPGVPEDWQQLSRPRAEELPGSRSGRAGGDDWFLVRTPEGRAGWVLTRMVLMSIPDEVAQNAAGHYIMGYHPLGETRHAETGEAKSNWLWTTSARGMLPYDFDGIRVFVYNHKRDRYETVFNERNLKGYYPVEVVDLSQQEGQSASGYEFSLVTEESGGAFVKRTYSFGNGRVRLLSKVPFQAPPPLPDVRVADSFDPAALPEKSWMQSLTEFRKRWLGR